MATVDDGELFFYPAFCFRASPTHFAWVKMGAADVRRLKRKAGFEALFFYGAGFSYIMSRSHLPRQSA
ncbi:hypothetical protein BDV26DRAFT_258533 [Aspergillus bertholletiae]|uniref:Uncharacterized protein n=1 Tax=Aspergillus bertholletiae TaxID=1226010 RepID=A0A5N7BDV7_9EURO|nr:hypothetical protein BDV26DRAFT_258533 [Aspergillus bertholletiae]